MSRLDGTGGLVRLALRRDRVRLPIWVLALTALTYFSGSSMGTTFNTQASIDAYASSVATSPAVVFLAGPPVALDTLPGIVLNKVSFVGLIGVCLMVILDVVRHTRGEEEAGRLELIGAGVVGRYAALTAALLVAVGTSLVLGFVTALSLIACGLPAGGSFALVAWAVAGLGMGLSYAPISLLMLRAAPPGAEGAASASLTLLDTLGIALGTGVGGAAVSAAASATRPAVDGIVALLLCTAVSGVTMLAVTRRLPGDTLTGEPSHVAQPIAP